MERLELTESLSLTMALLFVAKGVIELIAGNEALPWFALAASIFTVFTVAFTRNHEPPRMRARRTPRS